MGSIAPADKLGVTFVFIVIVLSCLSIAVSLRYGDRTTKRSDIAGGLTALLLGCGLLSSTALQNHPSRSLVSLLFTTGSLYFLVISLRSIRRYGSASSE